MVFALRQEAPEDLEGFDIGLVDFGHDPKRGFGALFVSERQEGVAEAMIQADILRIPAQRLFAEGRSPGVRTEQLREGHAQIGSEVENRPLDCAGIALFELLDGGHARARPGFAAVRIDLEDLPVQGDRVIVVFPANLLFGSFDVF